MSTASAARRFCGALAVTALALSAVLSAPSQAQDDPSEDGAQSTVPPKVVAAQAAVRPQPVTTFDRVATPVQRGRLLDLAAIRAVVSQEWASAGLGAPGSRSLTVRDVSTGRALVNLRADTPLVPASTVKLLTAAAITSTTDSASTLPTTVVAGDRPDDLVLVAGGDLLLSSGRGDPDQVVGRAGLADLAAQTKKALADSPTPTGPVRLLLDTQYAAGSDVAPGWTDYQVANGYAGRITMLGLARDRALPFDPSPSDPPLVAAEAFAEALRGTGVEVRGPVKRTESVEVEGARVLARVESAPLGEVLSLALQTSDNAMVEQLARQAAVQDGAGPRQGAVNAWVLQRLQQDYGIDTEGAQLADTSGLSDGTAVPVRVVADTLMAGARGEHPAYQAVLGGLPVAGYTGTLHDRFFQDRAAPGVGVVRAKTGSLPGVTTLAGTVVTQDDRLLVFAMMVNDLSRGGAELQARADLEALVADLASCGC